MLLWPATADEFFQSKIEPILKERCYDCHSHAAGKMKGGLTLDSRSGWAEGGDSGPAIIPAKPDESLLIEMVRWIDEDFQMPPKEQLPAAEIALLEEWVKRGAPDPRELTKPTTVLADWWSLKPLVRPEVAGGVHPVDGLANVEIAKEADRRTLIRRLYFDLHGLPPTPEAVRDFVEDPD
ncbi:MAG: c-type cytochrome domain-containing protein, partial [Verrucomicrobiota bacterium]